MDLRTVNQELKFGLIRNLEDTVLPLEYPVETPEGQITSVPIKKGTRVIMSLVMANRYERTWGERAREFWPERWIDRKPDEVTEPGAHLPGVYSSMYVLLCFSVVINPLSGKSIG